MKRVCILYSGVGTNMQALVEAAKQPDYPAEIVLTITDKYDTPGSDITFDHGLHKVFIGKGSNENEYQQQLISAMIDYKIDIICLAGFMRILKKPFLDCFSPRHILNIHPSILPKYKGLNTHARALAAGETIHGCTVHAVTEEVDAGEIILQKEVPVFPDDDVSTLQARVKEAEHKIFPQALKMVCES